jgi:hypothetical protein
MVGLALSLSSSMVPGGGWVCVSWCLGKEPSCSCLISLSEEGAVVALAPSANLRGRRARAPPDPSFPASSSTSTSTSTSTNSCKPASQSVGICQLTKSAGPPPLHFLAAGSLCKCRFSNRCAHNLPTDYPRDTGNLCGVRSSHHGRPSFH